jgi:YVTN family beta-propeller protein
VEQTPVKTAIGVLGLTLTLAAQPQGPLRFVRAIPLPNVEGRIDHLAADIEQRRLYVAALGNNTVEVLDVANGTHLKSVPGFHEPQGIAVVPASREVVVANGDTGDAVFLSSNDQHVVKTVALGGDADNVRFDATSSRVFVGYGSGAIGALDAREKKHAGDIRVSGHPESFQLESSGQRIFVNVPTARHIAVLDRNAMKPLATWPVAEARANYPMALDEAGHRLFIGCRQPAKALVFDTASGRQLASFEIVGDTDDVFFDSAQKTLYVIGGEGFIDVVTEQSAARFSRVARVTTAAGARTGLFVPQLHRLYLAVPHRGTQRAEVREYETARE